MREMEQRGASEAGRTHSPAPAGSTPAPATTPRETASGHQIGNSLSGERLWRVRLLGSLPDGITATGTRERLTLTDSETGCALTVDAGKGHDPWAAVRLGIARLLGVRAEGQHRSLAIAQNAVREDRKLVSIMDALTAAKLLS